MIKIPIALGISLDAKPSLHDLKKRAKSRVELVAANHADLDFLKRADFAEGCSLVVVQGKYELVGVAPRPNQLPLNQVNAMEGLLRDDEQEALQIKAIQDAMDLSSAVLDRVANILATSDHVKEDIRAFEKSTGVNTRHIRTFLYQKQESFDVVVDGVGVTFRAHDIRASAQSGKPIQVLFTPGRPSVEGRSLNARVDATCGDNKTLGVQSGGRHDFRFGLLEPWQAAVLEVAIQLQKQILVTAY